MNLAHKFDQWTDRLNPVLLKELRQTVRSGALLAALISVSAVLLIALVVQLGAMGASLALNRPIGREVFAVLASMLEFFAIVIIPINAGARLFAERKPHDVELFYASPLTAGRIIRGKLASASYETFLLFSLCAPFLFITTVLRGIDVVTVAAVLLLGFLLVLAAVQVAIFVGCFAVHHAIKAVLAAIALVVAGAGLMSIYLHAVQVMVLKGVGGYLHDLTSGNGIGICGIFVTVVSVLHGMSVAIIANAGGQMELADGTPTSPQVAHPQNHF